MEKLFSEIYNRYFGIVNLLLMKKGTISQKMLRDTVQKNGFGESLLFLLPKLSANEWEIFEEQDGAYRSKIRGGVKMPMSRLQKPVLADPRAGLFLEDAHRAALNDALADTEPLFRYEDFYYFDQFSDGDDYADAAYRRHFRTILQAIRNDRMIRVRYEARTGRTTRLFLKPQRLEYSAKNDRDADASSYPAYFTHAKCEGCGRRNGERMQRRDAPNGIAAAEGDAVYPRCP